MAQNRMLLLGRRFVFECRENGVRAAVHLSLRYILLRLRGVAPTTLFDGTAQGALPADGYLQGVWKTLAQADAFHIPQSPHVQRRRRQIAMIADLNLPQCRKYRVEQLAAFWRSRDVEFEYAHFADVPRSVRILQSATHLMEYRLQSGPQTDMLRYEASRLRLPILYDLDDPLFSVSAYETYGNMTAVDPEMKAHFLSAAPRYLSMMNGADILSVSTPGMAAHVALYSARPAFVRRNFADMETLAAGAAAMRHDTPDEDLFRIAFASGSQGHEADLDEILTPLADFLRADKRRRLMLLGHFDMRRLPKGLADQVETTRFSDYASYLGTLRRANCAVMPLSDDAFNRCKSAVRVIDAAAVGVPSVVGHVGDLPAMVRPGDTGLVVEDQNGWMDALRDLARNPQGARHMGQAARRDLETRWRASDQPHVIAPELIHWVEG